MSDIVLRLALIYGFWIILSIYLRVRDARMAEVYDSYREEIIYGPERQRDYDRMRRSWRQ